mmetsp:Transcript_65592/g.154260  ORF Transcript_65592/g.154260 Transcript_65592/m.154260 type:complete len:766 (+) Transcript_65592:74-2371(+)
MEYWWEKVLLLVVTAVYLIFYLVAILNRRRRAAQSQVSDAKRECERCSVELAQGLVPDATIPEYRFRGMRLKMSAIHIGFRDVGVKLNSDGRCILEGVTGEFRSQKMAAIMGPSGAGKTTFMNAICGRAYYGTVSGEIRINGHVSSVAEIKQLRGFVPQDDIVHEQLTVREQIYYSAKLRNAEKTPAWVIDDIVQDVLHVMQLIDVQHNLVGNVEETQGISGGQRKRVNIGLELAARPTILMLDEPTSGLDATTALDIMRSLKTLSKIGMTVVMVVHQPRYSLFTLFDEVLLLGLGGKTVYLGPSQGVLPYFTNLSFKMPEHENPADWFMDVISGKVKNEENPNLKSDGLAEVWTNRFSDIVVEASTDLSAKSSIDRLAFVKGLDSKLAANGLEQSADIDQKKLLTLLESVGVNEISPGALRELQDRIGFQDGVASRQQMVTFLHGLQASFSNDKLCDEATLNESMGISESSASSNANTNKKMSGKRARLCAQYPILLHQNIIRWMRLWKHKALTLTLMAFPAFVFGVQCKDKLNPEHVLCAIKINISHVAIGLMMGIACLPIFGSDRMVFWRESSSGVRVSAFFLARVSVFLFDVLVWCYVFVAAWKLSSEAPCEYWLWLVAFRMTAVSSAGIGVLLSTLIPKHSSTLATSVVLLVMGGAISEPQVVAEAKGSFNEVLACLSPFTWAVGENYLAVISELGGEDNVNIFALDMMDGYTNVLQKINFGGKPLDYLTSAYVSCSIFGFLGLTFGYLGLRFSHRGKQA